MFGSIMPDPLATPSRLACPDRAFLHFGWVSVVMMALAKDSTASAEFSRFVAMDRVPSRILSIGKGRPITPVEAGRTNSGCILSASAVHWHIFLASCNPCSLNPTLAHFELTTIA